ncbi:MAG: hypothetical protein LBD27_03550 [Tannerella sp.]|jgi:hypothetical protein|nr:hypothetical protein [Tannerella sp.]
MTETEKAYPMLFYGCISNEPAPNIPVLTFSTKTGRRGEIFSAVPPCFSIILNRFICCFSKNIRRKFGRSKKCRTFVLNMPPPLPVRTARSGGAIYFYLMTKIPYTKPFFTHREQLELLKLRGMKFTDEEKGLTSKTLCFLLKKSLTLSVKRIVYVTRIIKVRFT